MSGERSQLSQNWVAYSLGQLFGQHDELFKKMKVIAALHDKVKSGELDPSQVNTHTGLEELVELTKKYQNNASLLLTHVMMWRLDWKHEHGQAPEAPKVDADKP